MQTDQLPTLLTICGSTRSKSVNLSILRFLGDRFADKAHWQDSLPLDRIPHFNPDQDTDKPPEAVQLFRSQIETAHGLLICTPEYVFSVPGCLKNALEWLVSTTLLTDKPVALITAASSGVAGHASLQMILKTVGAHLQDTCNLLIGAPQTKLSPEGQITDAATCKALDQLMLSFLPVLLIQKS
ncbi:MAG TPA: NADPH-dependent FMN reductase [Sediminibacterium sp.]|nr:NADPH-dependent FMN reductase [Sediminibacterium sp.]